MKFYGHCSKAVLSFHNSPACDVGNSVGSLFKAFSVYPHAHVIVNWKPELQFGP